MSEPIPKKRGSPLMVAGGPSLNPKGRPRLGHALAELVRAQCDPAELLASLVALAKGPHVRHTDRLAAIRELLDRGWGKAIQQSEIDATVSAGDALPVGVERMSPEERAAWLATIPITAGGK